MLNRPEMVDRNSTISVVLGERGSTLETSGALGMRTAIIAAIVATLAFCAVGVSSPALAATANASVSAAPIKPLVLTKVGDLDLGTITLGPGVWSNATVAISQAGALTCNANVTCTGATQPAQYNVQGSNQQRVRISAPNLTLTNQSDPSQTLTMIVSAPASVMLTNSGFPGVNFSIGGSVSLNSTTSGGTYVGTFNVTVDY